MPGRRLLLRALSGWLAGLFLSGPVSANCAETVASFDFARPLLQAALARSGPAFGRIEADKILLSEAFDRLDAQAQREALLKLGYSDQSWIEMIEAYRQAQGIPDQELVERGVGARHPFATYRADGRLVAAPYDACTSFVLLNERQRYQWYYNRGMPRDQLYNGGRPAWRVLNFPLGLQAEKTVRLAFWRAMGYRAAQAGWWIAWVPELGHFEIDIPSRAELPLLQQRFLNRAPAGYRYQVMDATGQLLQ